MPQSDASFLMSILRKSAHGQMCLIRVPKVCNFNPDTTVLAHLNGAGMGMKEHDLFGCFACSDCHAWLDGGYARTHTRKERDLAHYEAIIRTQRKWLEDEFITIKEGM